MAHEDRAGHRIFISANQPMMNVGAAGQPHDVAGQGI